MNDKLPGVGALSTEGLDLLIMIGAILLVLLFIFFWALFVRQAKKRRVRKYKRRRPLNPTLAESGGLPPVREEKKTDAPTSPP